MEPRPEVYATESAPSPSSSGFRVECDALNVGL